MKTRLLWFVLAFLAAYGLVGSSAPAQDAKTDPAKTQEKTGEEKKGNPLLVPKVDPKFAKKHQQNLERAKQGDIDILMMGDSITDNWRSVGKEVFQKYWAPLKTANFGIGGDIVQGVIYRMNDGELDGYNPKLMMLMIGTNNTNGVSLNNVTAEQLAEAIQVIVSKFRDKHPQAKVLLLAIFPRETPGAAKREAAFRTNKIIAKLDDGKFVKYLDIGDKFMDKDGNIPKDIMADGLHPTAKGYQIWTDAVMPTVREMLGLPKQ